MDVRERLLQNARLVDEALARFSAGEDADFGVVLEAQRYSLMSRAKRIRPSFVLEFCRLFGGSDMAAIPFAVAVEMVHTYSLIHDDLPCMDDDDLRRGVPTCHKAFGEANALLAGDALLTRAFGVLAENRAVAPERICDAVAALSAAAGAYGMIGGQVIDLKGETERLPLAVLLRLHEKKTGELIAVSAELGCLAAGLTRDDPKTLAAKKFAFGVGLTFQIVDDILDAVSDPETLGKNVGSDAKHEKTTFLTYYDIEAARAYAARTTEQALDVIGMYEGSEILCGIAQYLVDRKH